MIAITKREVAVLSGLLIASSYTLAQSANSNQIEEILVTGSAIPRAGFESLQPASVLSNEELELRGSISVAEMINELPGMGTPFTSNIGQQSLATPGQNFANFLGIGARRTLTVVNGQRFPSAIFPSGNGGLAVDLNAIPENLVERVENIAVGGAPIYGTDAIAGTVNIILKENYEGLEIAASGGQSFEHRDGEELRLSVLWGTNFDNSRGNITLSAQTTDSEGMLATDREITFNDARFLPPVDRDSPVDQQIYPNRVIAATNVNRYPLYFGNRNGFNIFGNGIPVNINDPDSPLAQFDDFGNLRPFVPGDPTGSPIFKNGGDGFHQNETRQLLTDIERYNFTALANYELTSSLRLKGEAWFARSDSRQLITQGYWNDPAFGGLPGEGIGNIVDGPIPILIDSPFLPDASRRAINDALNVVQDGDGDGIADPTIDTDGDGVPDAIGFWTGGNLDIGGASNSSRQDMTRAVIGLEGYTTLFDREFDYDINVSFGRTRITSILPDVVLPRLNQAVQVVVDVNGNANCADPSGGCVPYNAIGTPTQAAIDYITSLEPAETELTQRVLTANINGDLFELPAGMVEVAGGVMYRKRRQQSTWVCLPSKIS